LTNGEILYPDYNFRWLDYEGIIKRFGGHFKVYTQSLFLRYTVKRFKVLSAYFTTRNRNSITITRRWTIIRATLCSTLSYI